MSYSGDVNTDEYRIYGLRESRRTGIVACDDTPT
jgi:hypothetical protein